MDLIVYGFLALFIGAVGLALYERRKGRRIIEDDAVVPDKSDRAAFAEADRIRATNNATQQPHGSGMG